MLDRHRFAGGYLRHSPPLLSLPSKPLLSLLMCSMVCVALAGCSIGMNTDPSIVAGPAMRGRVIGGQNPISRAQADLFAAASGAAGAGAAAYGGNGIAASGSNASVSLLTSAGNTTPDSNGDYYAT